MATQTLVSPHEDAADHAGPGQTLEEADLPGLRIPVDDLFTGLEALPG